MNTTERTDSLKFSKRVPTLEEFRELRINAGWRLPSAPIITDALKHTIFGVCVETREGATIGMGRIVGDRGLQIFITDLIVHKEWQNQGIGSKIMKLLMEYVENNTSPATFVGLFSAFGRHSFYEKFDFITRPNETLGPGMMFFPKRTKE
jgi:GNAT superfamily N-acetyltransferase